VEQRPEEHDDRAGAAGRLDIDAVEPELGRWNDLEVVAARDPAGADADRVQHLEDPVDLLDPGEIAQCRPAAIEQGRAQQRDRRVLRRLDVDGAAELLAADDAQVLRPGVPEGYEFRVEALADPSQGLEAEVLLALLDPSHGALTRPQQSGELCLRKALVPPRVADQGADPLEIGVGDGHARHHISDMRYLGQERQQEMRPRGGRRRLGR
jgi:hypothetical protein